MKRKEEISPLIVLLVQFLKVARLARGESQREVGARFGVSQGRMWDMENLRTEPTIPTIEKWADALEMDLTFTLSSRLKGFGGRPPDGITAPRTEWYGTDKDLQDTLDGVKK